MRAQITLLILASPKICTYFSFFCVSVSINNDVDDVWNAVVHGGCTMNRRPRVSVDVDETCSSIVPHRSMHLLTSINRHTHTLSALRPSCCRTAHRNVYPVCIVDVATLGWLGGWARGHRRRHVPSRHFYSLWTRSNFHDRLLHGFLLVGARRSDTLWSGLRESVLPFVLRLLLLLLSPHGFFLYWFYILHLILYILAFEKNYPHCFIVCILVCMCLSVCSVLLEDASSCIFFVGYCD